MSDTTKIQWCDSTVNPIMGCHGCELFPQPGAVIKAIANAMKDAGAQVSDNKVKETYKKLIDDVFRYSVYPHPAHKQQVTTTNIWHLRERFLNEVKTQYGKKASGAAKSAIRKEVTCYAAIQHLNKGANILDREGLRDKREEPRQVKKGYAPVFEQITYFEDRAVSMAKQKDLLGQYNKETPWKHRLPRMIFVSDMGDALSRVKDFPFLKSNLMPAIQSDDGRRHLWLWLTKRPGIMAKFADQLGGFPANVCAMTTLTGPDELSLKRLSELKKVKASIRGLSIEPLWDRIPPSKLNLKGIDWVILGGESGSGKLTRPFQLEWVEEMREHCKESGVAFFLKQLGRNPMQNGKLIKLKDRHGGGWNEWDESLRIRDFPQAFHDYRKEEMVESSIPRPIKIKQIKKTKLDPSITKEQKAEFRRHHKVVVKGIQAFAAVGSSLALIKAGKLWKAGGHKSWNDYCQSVVGMSRGHAHRLISAAELLVEMKTSPRGDVFPLMEAQVRPLLQLPDPEQRVEAWYSAVEQVEGEQPSAKVVKDVVFDILHPDGQNTKTKSRAEKRVALFTRLREVVQKKQSWSQVEKMLKDLEKLL